MQIKQTIGQVKPLIDDAFAIRYRVFIEEQGFEADAEVDEYDDHALHIVGYMDNRPVAVARLIFQDNGMSKIGRVAVLKPYRHLGLGKALMLYLIDYAKDKKLASLSLAAQLHAQDFYLKLGFMPEGEIFLEEGAEHVTMKYSL